MKSKKELKEYLLKYYVDENGDLDISELDFSDFNGNVKINKMKVKYCLDQNYQEVGGSLFQSNQKVHGCLFQGCQEVASDLLDSFNIVTGEYMTQTLSDDEEYQINNGTTYIVKKEEK